MTRCVHPETSLMGDFLFHLFEIFLQTKERDKMFQADHPAVVVVSPRQYILYLPAADLGV